MLGFVYNLSSFDSSKLSKSFILILIPRALIAFAGDVKSSAGFYCAKSLMSATLDFWGMRGTGP